ncbi:DUF4221 family protein [Hugenholtzia roseola]|uniref:DUF4221 family protein n=1 Tax=Hugenholtzia roseola TaxID=1002 RepID=UPI0004786E2C|nr:DUF4221 family protein [Hugenholtzia roseola]
MKKKLLIISLLFIFVLSCSQNKEQIIQSDVAETQTQLLRLVRTKSFPLDSLTQAQTPSLQAVEKGKQFLIYFFNRNDNTIRIFDYQKEIELTPIRYALEGEQGVGKIESFLYHNDDSIFLYAGGKCFLTDARGKVKESVKVAGEVKHWVLASTISQMAWQDDKLFLVGTRFDKNYSPFIEVSFTKKQVKENDYFLVSKEYDKGDWGGMNFDYVYAHYDKENKNWLVSFPNDKNLYQTDLQTKQEAFAAHSVFFDTVPPPYNNRAEAEADVNYIETFLKSSSFYSVMKDKYKGYIYRTTFLGVSSEDLASQDPIRSTLPPVSLIALNGNKEKVAELKLPLRKHLPHVHFFTPEGLHIARRDPENEDVLTFDIFQIEDIEK